MTYNVFDGTLNTAQSKAADFSA